jgi:PTH1 family peptidyl-tRNA hydrolase
MMIFGLGNPGLRYRFTRHNAGYLLVERLAKHYRKRFLRRKNYAASYIRVKGVGIILVKPRCWMNQCGHVIREIICDHSKDFMVVVDDINLPVGRARLRGQGSDGGHLGLRSLIAELQTDSFPRLRIGVGRPDIDAADYVLKRFTAEERKILLRVVNEAIKGVQIMVEHGFAKAQNHINAIKIE